MFPISYESTRRGFFRYGSGIHSSPISFSQPNTFVGSYDDAIRCLEAVARAHEAAPESNLLLGTIYLDKKMIPSAPYTFYGSISTNAVMTGKKNRRTTHRHREEGVFEKSAGLQRRCPERSGVDGDTEGT
ncbi:MAG: hypothetical protein LBB18_04330, partial [Puniceicoccales bacterium]|nr:hypothetical protein [Puniceicoccales bacterium]